MNEVDFRDGKVDGRMGSMGKVCFSCGWMISCCWLCCMYCGEFVGKDYVF